MPVASLDADLKAVIDGVRVVDTYEHLEEEADRLTAPIDFSRFFARFAAFDLLSAGMAGRDLTRFLAPETDLAEKWSLLAPFWPLIRHTGYGQAISRSVRDLYGIDELSALSCASLTESMRAANQAGVHARVIGERAGIDLCILHNLDGPGVVYRSRTDPRLCRQDLAIQHFLANVLPLAEMEQQTGVSVGSLRDLLRVIDWYYAHFGDSAVAVANNCAQWRTLRFDDVTQGQAETLFDRGYVAREGLSSSETKALQDFLFHYCLQRAIDYRLPIEIHTGYLEGSNRLDVSRIRAIDLIPLFRKYPQARFVVLHVGYPYPHELIAIARQFSNVYADLGRLWVLDPEAARRFVRQWVATTPINKLFAFGGGCVFADLVYGHAQMAREGLCRALSELIDERVLVRSDAEEIARRFLRENAWAAYRLDDKGGP